MIYTVAKNELFDRKDTNSLKGICMILIICHHLYQFAVSKYGIGVVMPFSTILQSLGYLATSVFFLLSGYGMFLSIKKNEPLTFSYISIHLSKLLLPFLFIWVIDLLCCLSMGGIDSMNVGYSLITLGLVGGGNSLWFLKEIVILYIATFIASILTRSDNLKTAILFLGVLLFVMMSIQRDRLSMWWNSVLCFPVGMLLACDKKRQRTPLVINLSKLTGLFLLFVLSFLIGKSNMVSGTAGSFLMVLSSITFALGTVELVRYCKIRNVIFNWIGKNSLIIYLSHIFLLVILLPLRPYYAYAAFVVMGTFILSWLYSQVIYRNAIERLTESNEIRK